MAFKTLLAISCQLKMCKEFYSSLIIAPSSKLKFLSLHLIASRRIPNTRQFLKFKSNLITSSLFSSFNSKSSIISLKGLLFNHKGVISILSISLISKVFSQFINNKPKFLLLLPLLLHNNLCFLVN